MEKFSFSNKFFLYLSLILIGFTVFVFGSFWTEWTEYPTNPVLDPASGVRAYYPSVTYNQNQFNGHGTAAYYKMWFASPDSGVGGIAHAYSDDGINWTEYNNSLPLPGLQAGANHPVVLFDPGGFNGGGFYYKIWYWNSSASLTSIGAIRYAESIDGITWQNDQPIQQHPTNQTLQLVDGVSGSYFYHLYGPGCLIYNSSATNIGSGTPDDKSDDLPMTYRYIMYYDSSGEGASPNGSIEQESLAYSTNGIYWIRYGDEPVLLPSGNAADWDGMYSFRATIIRLGSTYHMWYAGANGDNSIGTYYAHGIGHATSTDGLIWTKNPDNPVFHVTDGVGWRDVRTYTPCVIYDANGFSGHGESCNYKMWFTGRTGSNYTIGYAGLFDEPPVAVFDCISEGNVGEELCFDGSASYDPDGDDIVEYAWSLSSRPTGSSAVMSPINDEQSCFTPDIAGTYSVALMVASEKPGGIRTWSEEVRCDVTTQDRPPVAEFECIAEGNVGEELCFDGSTSSDPDGENIVEYAWRLSSRPSGSSANMSPENAAQSCFIPDVGGAYRVALRAASRNVDGENVWSEEVFCSVTTQDRPPVAVFECISEGKVGEKLCFNASASFDPDGENIVEYAWRLSAKPTGSSAVMSPQDAVQSCFTLDTAGSYTVALKVASSPRNADGENVWSEEVFCNITSQDRPPVAVFECIPEGKIGEKLCFNASASSDPDGENIVEYAWRLSAKPPGSSAIMSPQNAVQSCFTPDAAGPYTVALKVASKNVEGETVWSEEVFCNMTTQDRPPVAVFDCIPKGMVGEKRCFNASSSFDPDGDEIIEYAWSLSKKPRGSAAGMWEHTANTVRSCFTPDIDGIYIVSLTVTSMNTSGEKIESPTVSCEIWIQDRRPVTQFNCVPSGKVGEDICLDGSASYDPDGTEITGFSWTLVSKPLDSTAALSSQNSPKCCLSPDVEGIYKISLTVSSTNGAGQSIWSLQNICVMTIKGYTYCLCPEVVLLVERIEDRMWHKKYRIEKLSWTINSYYPGCEIKKYRIYRMESSTWQLVSEVDAHIREFEQKDVVEWHEYKVVPVLPDNRECSGKIDL